MKDGTTPLVSKKSKEKIGVLSKRKKKLQAVEVDEALKIIDHLLEDDAFYPLNVVKKSQLRAAQKRLGLSIIPRPTRVMHSLKGRKKVTPNVETTPVVYSSRTLSSDLESIQTVPLIQHDFKEIDDTIK